MRDIAYLFVITMLFGFAFLGSASSVTLYSQQEALALAFPDADRMEKKTHILSERQAAEVETTSRSKVESRLVTLYSAWRGETLLGYLHIDVHRVRTRPEGLMVALDSEGRVTRVQVLSFGEPQEYMPVRRWYELFAGKGPDDALRIGRDIDAVSGATLTTRATADSVRRAIAFHRVLLSG
jgi:transcriptional regulator of nitric oxide reductase